MNRPTRRRSRPSYVFLTPGLDPIGKLVIDVAELIGTDPEALRDRIIAAPSAFAAALREAREAYAHRYGVLAERVVIIVDQFEEIFKAPICEGQGEVFVDALVEACDQEDSPAVVVLAVRADFFGHCAAFRRLRPALEHPMVVGPMGADQLRATITKPAKAAGLAIEDGLEDLLLEDLDTTSRSSTTGPGGALPLLSHALLATWLNREGNRLTFAAYRATGGIAQAIANTAEATLDSLDLTSQLIARRLLLRLVHLGVGAEGTRRLALLSEVLPTPGMSDRQAAEHVLDVFVHARLLTVGTGTIEITHEALIRAWPRLRAWIDTDRAALLAHQQLSQDATAWDRGNRNPDLLYPASRLAPVQASVCQQNTRRITLTELERVFINASSQRVRHRTRRVRQLIAVLVTLLLLAASLGAVALQQGLVAQRERNLAQSRVVSAQADRVRNTDPALAKQLSLIAYRIAPTPEARSSLLDSTADRSVSRLLGPIGTVIHSVALSPDKRVLAAGSADRTVRLWDVRDPARPISLGPPLIGPTDAVTSLAFSPTGRILAAGSADKTVRLWSIDDPRRPSQLGTPLLGPTKIVNTVAFSPDGQVLVAGSSGGKLHRWNMADPRRPSPLGPPLAVNGDVNSVAFDPAGHVLAAGTSDAQITLWRTEDLGRRVAFERHLRGPSKSVNSLAFTPDGKSLAAGSSDQKVWMWDVSDRLSSPDGRSLAGPVSWIYSVAFSPDGNNLAAGSADNTVTVWEVRTKARVATLPHPSPVTSIAFGLDSHTLATASADGIARLWTIPGPIVTSDHGSVFTVAFSPESPYLVSGSDRAVELWAATDPMRLISSLSTDKRLDGTVAYGPQGRIAAGGKDGSVYLWNARDTAEPVALLQPTSRPKSTIQFVTFDPSGQLLAAGSAEGMIEIWDTADTRRTRPLAIIGTTDAGPNHDVFAVAFRHDRKVLAAASADGTVRLWKIDDPGRPIPLGSPLTVSQNAAYHVAFSPNGRILAAAAADGSVHLWNVVDPAHPQSLGPPLLYPKGYVYAVAFSPNGELLATANGDKTISLWDITDPRRPRIKGTLSGPSGAVFSVSFSSDGRRLAAGSQDGTIRIWAIDPDDAADLICSTTGDPITRDEWVQHVPGLAYNPPCPAPR